MINALVFTFSTRNNILNQIHIYKLNGWDDLYLEQL